MAQFRVPLIWLDESKAHRFLTTWTDWRPDWWRRMDFRHAHPLATPRTMITKFRIQTVLGDFLAPSQSNAYPRNSMIELKPQRYVSGKRTLPFALYRHQHFANIELLSRELASRFL